MVMLNYYLHSTSESALLLKNVQLLEQSELLSDKDSFPVYDHQRSKSASSQPESTDDDQHSRSVTPKSLLACIGEPLLNESEYCIHELPPGSNDISVNDLSLHDKSLNGQS